MRELQSTDERECRDIFTVVENLGELVLEVINVRLEAVILSHFDREEVAVILLGLPIGGILGKDDSVISLKLGSDRGYRE